ncbi:SGNH/GDSL hydrolase family protein [Limnoglobus roseus]|uniref:SGNH/GDSL hydrolase family protein n=1 Tax=Limnoglobus roseus TaxID=2598579 RepID=A0A5C1APQ8_9BACT|nr:SGNH/GDSL hydrolase family protein [Limnoglobus roseus]QEL18858.1 SGNH/GDSL hydrolase family protein [Limnoglobus roseus]
MPTRLSVALLEDRTVPSGVDDAPVLPAIDGVMQLHLQQIAAIGRQLGNRETVFAKVGDSNTFYPEFVTALGAAGYDPAANGLADRPDLVATWAAYHATPADGRTDSFARTSVASLVGYSSDNLRQNVATEIATVRPAVAIIMIGTNDIGNINSIPVFEDNLRRVIGICVNAGVIPVVSTVPDLLQHAEWEARVPAFNQAVQDVTTEADVPVWNFHRQTTALPNDGLRGDEIHLSISPNGSGQLGGSDLAYGANLRNRTTLEVLQKVRGIVFGGAAPDGEVTPVATPWVPLHAGEHVLAVGSGPGRGPEVAVYDADTQQLLSRIVPYEVGFRGGVATAVGDVTGDSVPDIVTGPGAGGGPVVNVFSGADGRLVRSWFAYEDSFRGGVMPAVGDVTGDGVADVAVGSGTGGGPRVRVFDGRDNAVVADFFAYEPTFRDGVNVAIATGSGGPRILTGPGVGGAPLLAAFDPRTGERVAGQFAFDPSLRGGLSVAAGDVTGDGVADWVVGGGPGGGPVVRTFDPAAGVWLGDFFAFDPASRAGVRVAVAGGRIATGQSSREGSAVRIGGDDVTPFGAFRGGVYVGGE